MKPNYNRNPIFHVNKFQQRLLFPVVIISILTSSMLVFAMLYLSYIGEHLALLTSTHPNDLQWAVPWFLDINKYNLVIPVLMLAIASILVIMVSWAYHVTHRIIGPHERVIRELDEVLSGQRKEPITTRKGDEVYEELLNRINALIKKLPS
jgi:hypothetical protein